MQIINEKPENGLEPFVPEFLESRLKELKVLKTALLNMNFGAIAKLAHTWKGFSRPYGFIQLEDIAKELEIHAKNKNLESCEALLQKTSQYLELKAKTI